MKIKVLKNFRHGSVSDPQRMIAGNVTEVPADVPAKTVAMWVELGWAEVVE